MRKAKAIELYDVGRFYHVEGYKVEPMLTSEKVIAGLDGESLVELAHIFGVDIDPTAVVSSSVDTKGKRRVRQAQWVEFLVYAGDPDNWKVDMLEAEVRDGVLFYRVSYQGEGVAYESAYSGRFAVHWLEVED